MQPNTATHLRSVLAEFEGRYLRLARAISPQGEVGETTVNLDAVEIQLAVGYLTTTLNYIKKLET